MGKRDRAFGFHAIGGALGGMSSFEESRKVEARSLALLGPFLNETGGRFVLADKGKLARFLQETCGDLFLNDRIGRLWGVELKAEGRWTGNLFLETWSNRNLERVEDHAARGSNPGWLLKTRADLLFYHFLDADRLVVLNTFALQRWAFRRASAKRSEQASRIPAGELAGRLYDFPERRQNKYEQLNDTWGRLVPVSVLHEEMEVRPRTFSVEQLTLQLLDGAA